MVDPRAREQEVNSLVGGRQYLKAVVAAIKDPPTSSPDQSEKDKTYEIVMTALASIQGARDVDGEIGKIVDEIANGSMGTSEDLADSLMKYIYRGLAEERSNALLFRWHSAVVSRTGLGSIIRAMTDRKSV